MQDHEWDALIKRLEDRDTMGVVIDSDGSSLIPEHWRLIDLRGKTTMPQAVEILKRSTGYLGIDSCFALLASQIHKPEDLLIRTNNPDVINHAQVYYPPHDRIDFLTPCIGKPRHPATTRPEPLEDGVLLECRRNVLVGDRVYGYGARVEVTRERAEAMIEADQAVAYVLED